jgi:hypothetical protein
MPSADLCAAFSEPHDPLSPDFGAAAQKICWGTFNGLRTLAGQIAMALDGYDFVAGSPLVQP